MTSEQKAIGAVGAFLVLGFATYLFIQSGNFAVTIVFLIGGVVALVAAINHARKK